MAATRAVTTMGEAAAVEASTGTMSRSASPRLDPRADRDADREADPGRDAQGFADQQPTAARHADDSRKGQNEARENPSLPGCRGGLGHEAERRKRQGTEGQSEPGRDERLVA